MGSEPQFLLAQTTAANESDLAAGMVVLAVIAILTYFIPTFIAGMRNHTSTLAIFVVNLAFGWSIVGWLVALIWALADNGRNHGAVVYQVNQVAPPMFAYPPPPPPYQPAPPPYQPHYAPAQQQQQHLPASPFTAVGGNKGTCPYCTSIVSAQAVYCPHCSNTLAPGSVRPIP